MKRNRRNKGAHYTFAQPAVAPFLPMPHNTGISSHICGHLRKTSIQFVSLAYPLHAHRTASTVQDTQRNPLNKVCGSRVTAKLPGTQWRMHRRKTRPVLTASIVSSTTCLKGESHVTFDNACNPLRTAVTCTSPDGYPLLACWRISLASAIPAVSFWPSILIQSLSLRASLWAPGKKFSKCFFSLFSHHNGGK